MTDDTHWGHVDLDFDADDMGVAADALFGVSPEFQDALHRNGKDGAVCPHCAKKSHIYQQRQITSAMATVLWHMRQLRLRVPSPTPLWLRTDGHGRQWVHTHDYMNTLVSDNKKHSDFPKLRWWGFLQSRMAMRADGSLRSGFWRITGEGMRFAVGERTAHQYAKEFRSKLLGLWGPQITIHDVSGFNFAKLMGAEREDV